MTRNERPPATPLYSGFFAAALAFVFPVFMGLVTGNMSGRDFGYIVLLTVGAFLVTYVIVAIQRRRAT